MYFIRYRSEHGAEEKRNDRQWQGPCSVTLGIIGGTSLLFSRLPPLEERRVATPFGSVDLLVGDIVMLMRHQDGIPPHRINNRAGLSALAIAGVDRVVAFGSSGSLHKEIPPGSMVAGVPAKVRRELSEAERAGISANGAAYVELTKAHARETGEA